MNDEMQKQSKIIDDLIELHDMTNDVLLKIRLLSNYY